MALIDQYCGRDTGRSRLMTVIENRCQRRALVENVIDDDHVPPGHGDFRGDTPEQLAATQATAITRSMQIIYLKGKPQPRQQVASGDQPTVHDTVKYRQLI